MSAQKMREVVRQIQGLPTAQAVAVLAVVPRKSDEYKGMNTDNLWVKSAVAGTATTLKRFTPKARGSAGPILKRTCHIKIVLSDD